MPAEGLAMSTPTSEESHNPTSFSYLLFSNIAKNLHSSPESLVNRNAGFKNTNTKAHHLMLSSNWNQANI